MPSLKSDFILDFLYLTLLNGMDFEIIDLVMTTHTNDGWRRKTSVLLNLLNVI